MEEEKKWTIPAVLSFSIIDPLFRSKANRYSIMAGNCEGEDITYIMSWRKLQDVRAVSKKVARKALELVIPFLEDWKETSLDATVEWVVDEHK